MRKLLSIVTLFAFFSFMSCEEHSNHVISKGKMKKVLYDFHLAQAMAEDLPYDQREKANVYINAVFEKHGITKEDFDSAVVWYNTHNEDLQDIYKDLQTQYTQEQEQLQLTTGNDAVAAFITEGGDTANIWTGPETIVLRNRDLLNLSKYTIKTDSTFHHDDRFTLMGDVEFVLEDKNIRDVFLSASLSIRNDEGKTFSQVRQLSSNSEFRLEVSSASGRELKQVSTFFYYIGKTDTKNFCVVNNIRLIRMHVKREEGQSMIGDPLKKDSTVQQVAPRQHGPRLTPEEIRKNAQDGSQHKINIKTAPDVRTPNKIGPRRRRPVKK